MFSAPPQDVFAAELFIVVAINAWGAMQRGYAPWPPTIVMMCIAIAILLLASIINAKAAEIVGVALLLASLIGNLQSASEDNDPSTAAKISTLFGATPPPGTPYDVLRMP